MLSYNSRRGAKRSSPLCVCENYEKKQNKTCGVVIFLCFCQHVFVILLFIIITIYSIILDLHFPSICYRKLLSPPVVPANLSARVGVVRNFNLDDLAQFMPVRIPTAARM